jgi:hypothetical protein
MVLGAIMRGSEYEDTDVTEDETRGATVAVGATVE